MVSIAHPSFPYFLLYRLFHLGRQQASKEWSSGLGNNQRPAAVGDVSLVPPTLPLSFRFSIQVHECHTQVIAAELSVAEPDSLDYWGKNVLKKQDLRAVILWDSPQ